MVEIQVIQIDAVIFMLLGLPYTIYSPIKRPIEARERFLHPENLLSPRQINPEISIRTEKAVLWAMNLHPDERPQDIELFRQALVGNWIPPIRPVGQSHPPSLRMVFSATYERILLWVAAGLLVLSLLLTLVR